MNNRMDIIAWDNDSQSWEIRNLLTSDADTFMFVGPVDRFSELELPASVGNLTLYFEVDADEVSTFVDAIPLADWGARGINVCVILANNEDYASALAEITPGLLNLHSYCQKVGIEWGIYSNATVGVAPDFDRETFTTIITTIGREPTVPQATLEYGPYMWNAYGVQVFFATAGSVGSYFPPYSISDLVYEACLAHFYNELGNSTVAPYSIFSTFL